MWAAFCPALIFIPCFQALDQLELSLRWNWAFWVNCSAGSHFLLSLISAFHWVGIGLCSLLQFWAALSAYCRLTAGAESVSANASSWMTGGRSAIEKNYSKQATALNHTANLSFAGRPNGGEILVMSIAPAGKGKENLLSADEKGAAGMQ